jgi:hypothetical protein
LDLLVAVHPYQLSMLATVCQEIRARLPRVQQLVLRSWMEKYREIRPAQEYAMVYAHMIGSYHLKKLTLYHDDPFVGTAILSTQASTLVELDLPLPILANSNSGFRMTCFPYVKKLSVRSAGMVHNLPDAPMGDRCVLYLGTTLPALESLSMDTDDLCAYGGEELAIILCMASTNLQLKYLELNTTRRLTALPSIPPITFTHLETLALHSLAFKKQHLHLLASVQWPALVSLTYQSKKIYPQLAVHMLEHAPKLKWLRIRIDSSQGFFTNLMYVFGHSIWPNLQGVCICNWNVHTDGILVDQLPVLQQACPNASIHLKFKKGKEYDSILVYGIQLSPQCNRTCYKCVAK